MINWNRRVEFCPRHVRGFYDVWANGVKDVC